MVKRIFILLFCCFHWYAKLDAQNTISTAKPWTYWWWMGSAVDTANVKVQLDYFAKT
jgi:hypothetical protein